VYAATHPGAVGKRLGSKNVAGAEAVELLARLADEAAEDGE
jgi:hypothetical protein